MLRNRYLFPGVYAILLLPSFLGLGNILKAILVFVHLLLAFIIGRRAIKRISNLLIASLATMVPFLVVVQSAVCSASGGQTFSSISQCVGYRSTDVLLNVLSFSSVLLLAV